MPAQLWISIVELGCFAGLMALGYLLVLRGAGIFMFALGPFAMFNAMMASWLVVRQGWPVPVAVVIGIVVAIASACLTELLIVRPIHVRTGGDEEPSIIAIVAILFAVEQLAGTLFGRTALPGLSWVSSDVLNENGVVLTGQTVLLVVVTLLSFLLIWMWLKHTGYGRMLRAVGDNERAARTLGVPVDRIRLIAFGMAGGLGGLAGALFAAKAGISFSTGLQWSLAGFLAVIVGGLGSVWAPLFGGLIVALIQTAAVFYFGHAMLDYATFVLAFIFFALRPKGIFQAKVRI
jgi:branched-chain amino acid transport system permease protein